MSQDYGKVAVLLGGWAAEREISLLSGTAVLQALQRQGVEAIAIDCAAAELPQRLLESGCVRVFVALHGRGGEDGVVQGLLDLLGLPYTGSGVLASALAMDKWRSKQVWNASGLAAPPARLQRGNGVPEWAVELGFPLAVKPSREGSSLGISRVDGADQLVEAFALAHRYDDEVLAERWVSGDEYTVAILNGRALPVIRLQTPHAFYDYAAKYVDDTTRYHCPCGLAPAAEAALQQLALDAFAALGASGWGWVDPIVDANDKAWLIELNTVPGMTDHSLVPMAAAAAGIDFDRLVLEILDTSRGKSR